MVADEDGERAVIGCAWRRGHAKRHLPLHHDGNRFEDARFNEGYQDRRRDVIRQIGTDGVPEAGHLPADRFGDVQLQDITGNDFHVFAVCQCLAQDGQELLIQFHGCDGAGAAAERQRQRADARPDQSGSSFIPLS